MVCCYEIQSAGRSSEERLRALLRRVWFATYIPELGAATTTRLLDTLETPDVGGVLSAADSFGFFAIVDSQDVGFIAGATRAGTTYLWALYVDAQFQRKGIGRSLLVAAIKACQPSDSCEITVLRSSTGALGFYRSLGFREKKPIEFEVVEGQKCPAIVMQAVTGQLQGRTICCGNQST